MSVVTSQPELKAKAAAHRDPARLVRRVENGRLAYYTGAADPAFWDRHWETDLSLDDYAAALQGSLGFFNDTFPRHLPREGRIVEAGCGLAKLVVALRKRGYDCEGVDSSAPTIRRVRAVMPDLPVRAADVLGLDVPDGRYAGYISLGVVEHRREGPEPFLGEAHRVLRDDGVLLVSVPHFHGLRRLKHALGLYGGNPEGLGFYQYAFRAGEMAAILEQCGFRVDAVYGYDPFKGLKDEAPSVLRIFACPGIGKRIERAWRNYAWAQRHLGHMILFACRKGRVSG
jgi:SAM-dependent methyltransferase